MPLLVGLVLMLTVGLMLLFKDVVHQAIVVPVSYVYWLAGLALASLHQGVIWVELVLAAAILLLRSLRTHGQQRPTVAGHHLGSEQTGQGRVAFWKTHIARVVVRGYPGDTSRHELRKLMLSVLAYQRHTIPTQIEAYLQGGNVQVPPEIALYLEDRLPEHDLVASSPSRLKRWLSALPGVRSDAPDVPHKRGLECTVQFLECQLEIAHDHHSE